MHLNRLGTVKILATALIMLTLYPGQAHSESVETGSASSTDDGGKHIIDLSRWKMVWEDDFDYPNEVLDQRWESQNGPSSHILCSRWRENAVVSDGILYLINKKERRGGQDWTSASIWTKEKFKYGYFECRYRYAEASATNNSFWLMTRGKNPAAGKRFEIDINEGHYPNEVNTNIHNHSDITVRADGKKTHPSDPKRFTFGTRPDYAYSLETPIKTRKIRLISNHSPHFHIREFRVYGVNDGNYPETLSDTADRDIPGLINYTQKPNVSITASGVNNDTTSPKHVADGQIATSWISQSQGEKWLAFEWPHEITVGNLQFINGWQDSNMAWNGLLSDFRIQYHDGTDWVDMSGPDTGEGTDFGRDYHLFGLEWNEEEIVFYLDRKEIRRAPNKFCHSEAPIWLSLAIVAWDGPVTDAVDGSSMKVDWVRYYQPKEKE